MSFCQHDTHCPGYGLAHDAGMSKSERESIGVPLGKDLSQQKLKRLLRSLRKQQREEDERDRWARDLFIQMPEEDDDADE